MDANDTNYNANSKRKLKNKLTLKGKGNAAGFCATNCGSLSSGLGKARPPMV